MENTHEAIIDKADFDLVQHLKGLDTRTSPQSDKVYLFSGVLICGCCGGRMTRKINRSNSKEYIYYYCHTGKKGGCKSSSMIKESELTECVRSSLKAHINSVVSLNSVITSVSRERLNQGLVQEYTGYIRSNEEQLARVENFKRKLYENLVSGALSKEEFLQYKQEYSAKAEEMLDGDFIGARAPFGYKKSANNCHKLIVDEETAPIVHQIFEWAASGMGVNTITVRLNEMGAVTSSVYKSQTSEVEKRYRQNRNWTTFTVAHILDNPVYMGDMVQGKSKTIEHKQQDAPPEDYIIVRNTHEAIVSRELFETVNKIRSAVREEYKSKPINAYSENIFKDLVFCPHCGKPLHRQRGNIRKDGTGIYRFHCISPSRISKAACIGVNINEQEVIDFVSGALKTELSALKKSVPQADKSDILKHQKSDKQRELKRVQSLIRGLYENLVNGLFQVMNTRSLRAITRQNPRNLKRKLIR